MQVLPRALAEIDLAALQYNLQEVKSFAPSAEVLAMVKANAYGHGMQIIAHALEGKVDYLGVANFSEALELREAGIASRIVVMSGFIDESELQLAYQLDCDVVLHSAEQLELLLSFVETQRLFLSTKQPLAVWLKANTGMNRLGLQEQALLKAYHFLQSVPWVNLVALMTHFACADTASHPLNRLQLSKFIELAHEVNLPLSVVNSAALSWPGFFGENAFKNRKFIIRPGLALYGYWPMSLPTLPKLKPVMTLKARIIAISQLSVGETVGYGALWQAKKPTTLAIVALGYADGLSQMLFHNALVYLNGCLVPIVGKVSMDSFAIDISACEARVGQYVELFGMNHPLDKWLHENNIELSCYALLSRLSQRIERVNI